MPSRHAEEVEGGRRFEFGKNWASFLRILDEERIDVAVDSLREMLDVESLLGRRFLDIGSGSGLFSLAARRLGARVHSLDYDPQSVACTRELRRRYFPEDREWEIEEASVLDADSMRRLGSFDVVYSWGVLHHTGSMWRALENVHPPVAPGGLLYIAIYNHQVYWTALYTGLKRLYAASPIPVRWLITGAFILVQVAKGLFKDMLMFNNPLQRYRGKKRSRGMSVWHDWIDWVGGYPFEAARPEEIFDFFRIRGFALMRLKTCGGGHGCNEFVFARQENVRTSLLPR